MLEHRQRTRNHRASRSLATKKVANKTGDLVSIFDGGMHPLQEGLKRARELACLRI